MPATMNSGLSWNVVSLLTFTCVQLWLSGLTVGTDVFDSSACGQTKGCLFKPANCTPFNDCIYAFSYRSDAERLFMEVFGTVPAATNAYVAVGFSEDDLMGSDTVTDCTSFSEAPFKGRLSYNPGKSNRKVPIDDDIQAKLLITHGTLYKEGFLYCQLSQQIKPVGNIQNYYVRALDAPFRILMASGTTDGEELQVHSLDDNSPKFPFVSDESVDLAKYKQASFKFEEISEQSSNITGVLPTPLTDTEDADEHASATNVTESLDNFFLNALSLKNDSASVPKASMKNMPELNTTSLPPIPNITLADFNQPLVTSNPEDARVVEKVAVTELRLMRAHGILMSLAWMVFIPTAILFARYCRGQWPNRTPFGIQIWFHVHRTCNLLGVICTIAAFACIFIAKNGYWKGPQVFDSDPAKSDWGALHSFLGLFACCIAWAQPINSLFRGHPTARYRFIFNGVHRSLGILAFLLACATLMIACMYFGGRFTNARAAFGLYVAFLSVLALCLVFLEITKVLDWWRLRSDRIATAEFMLTTTQASGKSVSPQREKSKLHAALLTRAIVAAFVFTAIGTAITICVLIGLKQN